MYIEAIYASKLFKASQHKDRIVQAMDDPINQELMVQLKSYLDVKEDSDANESDNSTKPSKPNKRVIYHTDPMDTDNTAKPTKNTKETNSKPMSDGVNDTDLTDAKMDSTGDGITDTAVQTSTQIQASNSMPDFKIAVNGIKGILNSSSDTDGVIRVLKQADELWIYYQDSVNLNNIMNAIIELLNASEYTYLKFNRLARSDNAIVFDISITDTDNVIDFIDGDVSV